MINKLSLKDETDFLSLGSEIHSNFSKLYALEEILNNEAHHLYGYYIDEKLVGFIHLTQSFEVFDLVTLIVEQDFRKKGIASSLLNYVFLNLNEMKKLLLEVRKSNKKAISLYKKMGFKTLNVRKKYYGDEDALIMEKVF